MFPAGFPSKFEEKSMDNLASIKTIKKNALMADMGRDAPKKIIWDLWAIFCYFDVKCATFCTLAVLVIPNVFMYQARLL